MDRFYKRCFRKWLRNVFFVPFSNDPLQHPISLVFTYLTNNSEFDSSQKTILSYKKRTWVFFLSLISGILCCSKNNLKIKIHNGHLTHIYALRGYFFPLGGCNITVFPLLLLILNSINRKSNTWLDA